MAFDFYFLYFVLILVCVTDTFAMDPPLEVEADMTRRQPRLTCHDFIGSILAFAVFLFFCFWIWDILRSFSWRAVVFVDTWYYTVNMIPCTTSVHDGIILHLVGTCVFSLGFLRFVRWVVF